MPGDPDSNVCEDHMPPMVHPSLSFVASVIREQPAVGGYRMLHMQLTVYNHGSNPQGDGTPMKGGADEYTTVTTFQVAVAVSPMGCVKSFPVLNPGRVIQVSGDLI
ncbi:hypothetical protein Asppvi_001758, partial [Aspergillus pseudoviridinutans]